MNNLLFLECSPYGQNSRGAHLVEQVVGDLIADQEHVQVVRRYLASDPLPAISTPYAGAITSSAPFNDPAFAVSEALIVELEASDGLVISTPMHNFTVPATLKLWIDHVLRMNRSFTATPSGKVGLLKDKPTLVIVRSGGPCVGESARQPDFLTPYLKHVLVVLGIHSVEFIYLPGLSPTAAEIASLRHAASRLPLFSSLGEPS